MAAITTILLLFVLFWVAADWADAYLMDYRFFTPSRGELALSVNLFVFVLPATVLAAWLVGSWMPGLSSDFDRLRNQPRLWAWALFSALVVLVLARIVRGAILQGAPVTDDEHVYEFQARILASGRLYLDSLPPPIRAFFDNQFIVNNGKWFGLYFLGHPALLAAAMRVGMAEWLGPIEAALTLLLAVGIAGRIFGPRVGIISGVFLVVSPFFLALSASRLSQPSSALMLMLFTYASVRIESEPRSVRWWGLAGAGLAYGTLIRPQTAAFFALPFLVRLARLLVRKALRPGPAGPVTGGLILGAGAIALLSINYTLTGSPFRTGYQAYMDQGIPWLFPVGPYYSLREMSRALTEVNLWLFGWPASLVFLPFFARRGPAVAVASVPILAFIWYGAIGTPTVVAVGPVYYGECIVPLAMLSASGLEQVVTWIRQRLGDIALARAVVAWPVTAAVGAMLSFIPVQVSSLRLMSSLTLLPYTEAERQRLDDALVFVHSLPSRHLTPGTWVQHHRNPLPDLSDRVLFVRDLGSDKNKALTEHFPHRTPYLMGMDGRELRLVRIGS